MHAKWVDDDNNVDALTILKKVFKHNISVRSKFTSYRLISIKMNLTTSKGHNDNLFLRSGRRKGCRSSLATRRRRKAWRSKGLKVEDEEEGWR